MKRLFYTMLAVCLLVLLALPAGAAERDTAFSDQAEIRNGYAVQMLVELELIGGYKDGSFRPGAPITFRRPPRASYAEPARAEIVLQPPPAKTRQRLSLIRL